MEGGEVVVSGGGGMIAGLVMLVIMVAVYIFYCYCAKLICEKVGKEPGVLIWIPIVQILPLLEAAGMEKWMIILFFVPFVNILAALYMAYKLVLARGKPPVLVVMAVIPIVSLAFFPYLAFSE